MKNNHINRFMHRRKSIGCREMELEDDNKEYSGLDVLCQFSKEDIQDDNKRKFYRIF